MTPDHVNWAEHYPAYFNVTQQTDDASSSPAAAATTVTATPVTAAAQVRIADVGCGFGGMTVALGEIFPDKLVLGLEIRDRVVDIVKQRISKLRTDAAAAATTAAAGKAKAKTEALATTADGKSYRITNSASPSPPLWAEHAPSYQPTAHAFTYDNIACVKVNFMKVRRVRQ